jgi:hypothetical protein
VHSLVRYNTTCPQLNCGHGAVEISEATTMNGHAGSCTDNHSMQLMRQLADDQYGNDVQFVLPDSVQVMIMPRHQHVRISTNDRSQLRLRRRNSIHKRPVIEREGQTPIMSWQLFGEP